ncbi:cupin domain-containing protein [Kitasatospora kifunensis]|uniref:Mannose-6-phosphate isomerase-like protein (Cupin superfamily) n=1 Tax=Kitasatospora kifunensis TaxID=58351 RepID=A0A7W7R3P8_KITKI|nr:cupin domain-containing protein [Kitasatospora kifunensis]MBB4924892.1 mannose-6-phosphate isomerase-like protein (cupin superfamily) [Kitasatospora kifunensis]
MQKFTIGDSKLESEYGIGIGRWDRYPGTGNLPFDAMWCQVPADSQSTPDSHPEVELAIVLGGEATFTVDGVDTAAPVGTAMLLSPGERHVITANGGPVSILSIYWLPGTGRVSDDA